MYINHGMNCSSNCIIYLLTCKVCSKQYVGQTTIKFRERWNNYKNHFRMISDSEEGVPQEAFHEHFLSEGHHSVVEDISITLIDKTDGGDPKRRERYWIATLRTLSPLGLNMEESK